ncbi:MAG: class I SAM-dependent methyltransferase [Flavobacteriaceae bacterium]|nr:class I SAM-dependent methyltransferase [Flavobacteriaceae bacterium]
MKNNNLKGIIGNTDIYLLDQILKSRYNEDDKILDVGCGKGRNIQWFYDNGFDVYGIDKNEKPINAVKKTFSKLSSNFSVSEVENLPFKDEYFDHIICNAVLHFAKNTDHFLTMFSEMTRVLKAKGTLFIRMTSNIGIEDKIKLISEGVYLLPDTSHRFLLNKQLLEQIMKTHNLTSLELLKTVNVNDLRCMTTLVLQKQK